MDILLNFQGSNDDYLPKNYLKITQRDILLNFQGLNDDYLPKHFQK